MSISKKLIIAFLVTMTLPIIVIAVMKGGLTTGAQNGVPHDFEQMSYTEAMDDFEWIFAVRVAIIN